VDGKACLAVLATAAAALGGCAVGPDFKNPSPPPVDRYTREPAPAATASAPVAGGTTQRFAPDSDIPGDWWTLFHSAALNRLVAEALRNNPDFDAAQAALRQADEAVYAAQGRLLPAAEANVAAERQRLDGAIIGEPQYAPTFTVVTASVQVSYAPDVFGGTRRQIEAAAAQAEYQGFALEATYLTLTSELVICAVQEASLREQIAATQEILRLEENELDLVRQQFGVGVVSQAEVLLQQSQLEQTRASLPVLQKQLAQLRNALTALVGRFPSEEVEETFTLAQLTLPQELPVSVPAKLIEQRPDVRQARAALHAASAEIGIATADQLPQFSISAALGKTTTGVDALPGTTVWNLASGVGETVFDAGTLLHRKRAAVAAYERASAQYRSTVLKSLQNVADVLRALQSDADNLAAQEAAARAVYASLLVVRARFHAQTVDFTQVLIAERNWQQARISEVRAASDRYADSAALFQALGGGWWHRSDAVATAK